MNFSSDAWRFSDCLKSFFLILDADKYLSNSTCHSGRYFQPILNEIDRQTILSQKAGNFRRIYSSKSVCFFISLIVGRKIDRMDGFQKRWGLLETNFDNARAYIGYVPSEKTKRKFLKVLKEVYYSIVGIVGRNWQKLVVLNMERFLLVLSKAKELKPQIKPILE